ncbi:MAG: NAD(P)-dependent oxidoreductase [Candidatus Omnitrophica bacterium]|nr:NAD(P)-dependent oxidoreductase [Candidatus Omnitrophota bacterium]MDD5774540.1 NAD(P)-dependent oxidoreductase [Candidatus Omnitrophota bacterium]
MDKQSIALITSTGQVGGNIKRALKARGRAVVDTYYPAVDRPLGLPVDISSESSVRGLFETVKPSIVILTAALTNVEFCEENRDAAWAANVTGPENVAHLCKIFRAKLVFFSSEYVFDGQAGPYSETDTPHPISVYGETKLAAERAVQSIVDDHLIIRTTIVYGYETMGKNFCYRLMNTLKAGDRIKVPFDQIGSPTYAFNLAEVVADLVLRDKRGIYNVVGTERVDRYGFARRVCATFGLDDRLLVPVTTRELNQKAARPLQGGLLIDKVFQDSSIPLMGIDEGLSAFKKELDGHTSA